MKSTILVGLQNGDEGKGKVAYQWMLKNNNFSHAIRFNGGPNAGHCVYANNQRYILHQIPTGILFPNITCVIGPGCVVDINKLTNEINTLSAQGVPNIYERLFISSQAHLITQKHIEQDRSMNKVGTTASGIGPCYADKAYRTGTRFSSAALDTPVRIIEFYDLLTQIPADNHVFWEGAQGFELDTNWGDYPFVTSSNCTSAGAFLCGAPFRSVETVIGAAKVYETYLGTKKFQPETDELLPLIQKLGGEVGNTTGRVRQCNYLHLPRLLRAIQINSVDCIVLNKGDILQEANIYQYYDLNQQLKRCDTWEDFKNEVQQCVGNIQIIWSCSPFEL